MCLWIYRPDDAKRKKNVHDIINLFYKSQRNAKNQKQNNIIFKSSVKMTNFGLFIISVVKTKYNCEIHFCQNFQCFLFVYISSNICQYDGFGLYTFYAIFIQWKLIKNSETTWKHGRYSTNPASWTVFTQKVLSIF